MATKPAKKKAASAASAAAAALTGGKTTAAAAGDQVDSAGASDGTNTDAGAGAGAGAGANTDAAGASSAANLGEATERLAELDQRPAAMRTDGPAAYRVISALELDKRLYAAGEEVTLTVDQAAPLLGHTVELKNATADDA